MTNTEQKIGVIAVLSSVITMANQIELQVLDEAEYDYVGALLDRIPDTVGIEEYDRVTCETLKLTARELFEKLQRLVEQGKMVN